MSDKLYDCELCGLPVDLDDPTTRLASGEEAHVECVETSAVRCAGVCGTVTTEDMAEHMWVQSETRYWCRDCAGGHIQMLEDALDTLRPLTALVATYRTAYAAWKASYDASPVAAEDLSAAQREALHAYQAAQAALHREVARG